MKRIFFYVAMVLIVMYMAYLNFRSLNFLTEDYDPIGKKFAAIGALLFAMFTILVMRCNSQKWIKIVFPVFDMLFVMAGFNLRFADNLFGNPVAFGLTIFISVFTGLITYSLGSINVNGFEKKAGNILSPEIGLSILQTQLAHKQNEIIHLKSQISDQEEFIEKGKSEIADLKSQISKIESEKQKFRQSHLLAERSRIRKKKVHNRTVEEMETLEESSRID